MTQRSKIKKLSIFEVAVCGEGMNKEATISIHKAARPLSQQERESALRKTDPAGVRPGDTKEGLMAGEAEKITALEASIAKKDEALVQASTALTDTKAALTKAEKERDDAKAQAEALTKAADIAKADEVMTIEGVEVRKSVVGETSYKVMKAQAERIELAEFAKSAEGAEYGNLPGEPIAKAAALRAISKAPEAERKTVEDMLKAGNAAMATQFQPAGQGGGRFSIVTKAEDKLDALAKAHAEKNNITKEAAYDIVTQTTEGKALYGQMESEQAARRASAAA